MTKKSGLSEQDEALWRHYTASVRPLRPQDRSPHKETPAPPQKSMSTKPASPPAVPPKAPSPQFFDQATRRKIRRGKTSIEGRIDLHGLTQAEAHRALERFILGSHARGRKCVLVITGKGTFSLQSKSENAGVLRRMVPHWLGAPPLASHVLGFEAAGPRHGGEGALYVMLRRRK